eukprot:8840801-Ditylum_brightwellii.AAC.1
MPHPHKHEEWLAQRKAKQAAQESKTPDGAAKRKLSKDKPGSSKRGAAAGKLKLSKSFKTALVSKVQLSDAKIQDVIDCAMNAADDGNQNDDEDVSK